MKEVIPLIEQGKAFIDSDITGWACLIRMWIWRATAAQKKESWFLSQRRPAGVFREH
jgi:hypothetical protein